MSANETPTERESRLCDVLLEYEKARDEGRAPDRRELLERHPDLAEELETLIPERNLLAELLGPPAAGGYPSAPPGYEIVAELGRSGMSVVYMARQNSPERVVALKMIRDPEYAGQEERARLLREADALARLGHPNIVQIYEVGEHQGQPFFSLEYVEGGDLAGRLGGRPQPPGWAAKVVALLARAMQAAHEKSVVHRDLKPANVLLTKDGTPKITDFGLAKLLDGRATETQPGQVPGTLLYMAPEQADGRAHQVGPLTDVHALGVILYEMLTGRPPFQGPTLADTLAQIPTQRPVPPSLHQPTVPAALERVCLKCLEKQPSRRYASAQELAEDLEGYPHGLPPRHARPETLWEWVVELFSQSAHVEHFGDIAWVHLCMAPVMLTVHVGVFFLLRLAAPEAFVWPLLFGWYAVLFGLIWKRDSARPRLLVPVERLARLIWVGHLLGFAAVCVGFRLADSDYVAAVRQAYPTLCALNGLAYMVLAASYWSRYYLFGSVYFVLAFVAAWAPEWAPLVVGLYSGGFGLVNDLWMRRDRRAAREGESDSPRGLP
jgi:hypothetical protein